MDTKAWRDVWQKLLPGPPVPGGYVDPRAGFFGKSLPGPWIRFSPRRHPETGYGVLIRPE